MKTNKRRDKQRDFLAFIEDILESIELVGIYLSGRNKQDLFASTALQDQVVRRIEIIGEAVRHLPLDMREKYPEVAWRGIAGMRDMVIHEYFNVNLNIAWDTATIELPKLQRQISKILAEIEKKAESKS